MHFIRVRNQIEFLFRSATCRLHNNVPGLHVAYTSHTDDSLQFYRITCPQEQGQHGLSFNGAWQLQVPDLCPISFLWISEAGSFVALRLMHQHGRQLCRPKGPSGKNPLEPSQELPARHAKQIQADATRIGLIETSLKLHCFSMFHMSLDKFHLFEICEFM